MIDRKRSAIAITGLLLLIGGARVIRKRRRNK